MSSQPGLWLWLSASQFPHGIDGVDQQQGIGVCVQVMTSANYAPHALMTYLTLGPTPLPPFSAPDSILSLRLILILSRKLSLILSLSLSPFGLQV